MEATQDMAPLLAILPVVYVLVDLVRPIPGVRSWLLPIIASVFGAILGTLWALAGGIESGQDLIVYAAFGFSFGSGATGANQIKKQVEEVSSSTSHR